jgi:succinylglutamate desuccinylase
MKILLIGATHGNELLGVKLYQHLLRTRSPLIEHIDFIVGNPRAYACRIRYTESDLNRSYGQGDNTYEQRRANKIQQYVATTKPDLVIDAHTTSTIQPNILIVGNIVDENVKRFMRASHIGTVLKVQPMHDSASIAPNVVGYEVSNRGISIELLNKIILDLERYINGSSGQMSKKLYTMTGRIYKKDIAPEQAATFKNFHMHQLGFVPIMTGNNSYKKQTDYLGFKSDSPEEITL